MQSSPLGSVIQTWGSPSLEGLDLSSVADGQRMRGINRQYVRFYRRKFFEPYSVRVEKGPRAPNGTISETIREVGMREVEREMVFIKTPGSTNEIDCPAEEFHRREHWRHYKAFRDGTAEPLGTPVDSAEFISQPVATELKYLGCQTVEQLADASDLLCGRIPNGWEMREYARQYCKISAQNTNSQQIQVMATELAEAKRLIAELSEKVQGAGAPKQDSPKRGRPAKNAEIIITDES